MAAQIWKNNFDSMLAVAAGTGDTTLRLVSSATALLGSLTGGDWMILTCYKRSGSVESDIEIVKVTNVDPNAGGDCILTVVRAQEGTVAKAYLAGDPVSMRLTAGGLNATASDSELAAHTGDIANPHAVTKTQVGLGSVDNTSDASKPVSTLQQTALDLKVATSSRDAINGIPGLTVLKLNLRNAANTITSWFTNVATVARTWTMPDKDGTVAMTSDITGGGQSGSFAALAVSGNTTLGDSAADTVAVSGSLTSGRHVAKQTAETGVPSFGSTVERQANDAFIGFGYNVTGDSFRIQASYGSTGSYKPLTFWTLDNERMRIATDGAVTIPGNLSVGSLNSGPLGGFRNRIINGGFDVWQRGDTVSAGLGTYVADRWRVYSAGANTVVTKDVTFNTPVLLVTGATSNITVNVGQPIESSNIADLVDAPATFSFEIYSSTARSVGYLSYYFNTKDSGPNAQTAGPSNASLLTTSVNTWQKVSVTIATLPTAFKNGGNFEMAIGAITAGQTVRIRNVQLEPGTVPTPFEARPIGTELALCQRYFEKVPNTLIVGCGAQNYPRWHYNYKVTKRVTPTSVTFYDVNGVAGQLSVWNGSFTSYTVANSAISDQGCTTEAQSVTVLGSRAFIQGGADINAEL